MSVRINQSVRGRVFVAEVVQFLVLVLVPVPVPVLDPDPGHVVFPDLGKFFFIQ